MIGLKRGTVKLTSYNPSWIRIFNLEKILLKKVLGDLVMDIQHIGSTSIPGISAKPVIDISIGLKNLRDIKKCVKPLESLGYKFRKDRTQPGHYLFVKGPEIKRTHYSHLVRYKGLIWKNDLLFRDYLRKNKKRAKEYDNLKKNLAQKHPHNRRSYTKSKESFIRETIKLAKSS